MPYRKRLALLFFLSLFVLGCQSQDSDQTSSSYEDQILEHRKGLNDDFRDEKISPLPPKDRKHFTGLKYFPIDSTYLVHGQFERIANQSPFMMPHTNDFELEYQKYGEITFELKGQTLKLSVYQNLELIQQEEYKDHLFIPFTDITNGESTYGGGRYLEFSIPDSSTVTLDFNLAYNPYCAYNGKYRCPIPPKENDLNFAVEAGEKLYAKH